MCCLRYEHEFYVLSRRKFPKEGKILVTSKGEEKVIACDIFHERVTLRTADGDTRVVALADLQAEVGGGETDGGVGVGVGVGVEVEVEVAAVVEVLTLDAPLDSTTASMLDTAEYEVAVLAGIDLAPRSGAEASAPSESGSDDAGATSPDADGAPRRKRRRGRRGGRRLRAAEERRKEGDADADGDADDDTDADHDLD